MVAMQVSLIAFSLLGGWLYSRTGSPAIGILSISAIALGLAVMGRIGVDLPFTGLFPLVALLGAGLGVFTAVNNTAIMSSVTAEQRGFASGLVETTRQLGHSLGVTVSSGILQTSLAAATIPQLGYREGFSQAATRRPRRSNRPENSTAAGTPPVDSPSSFSCSSKKRTSSFTSSSDTVITPCASPCTIGNVSAPGCWVRMPSAIVSGGGMRPGWPAAMLSSQSLDVSVSTPTIFILGNRLLAATVQPDSSPPPPTGSSSQATSP